MAHQAQITLTAITPGMTPSVRHLQLNPKQTSIPIGRASKSIQKGLVAAESNAWFDSPVMSREHAELILDEEHVCINIQDVASMHGTAINGVKIAANVPQRLNKLDILEFGACVRRGPQSFPACQFRIDWDFREWSPGFAVSVPDSSDVEDWYDSEVEEDHHSPNSATPDESPKAKVVVKVADTIDLTKEDSDDEVQYTGPAGLSEEDATHDRDTMLALATAKKMIHDLAAEELDEDSQELDLDDGSIPDNQANANEEIASFDANSITSSISDHSSDSGSNKENDDEAEDSEEEDEYDINIGADLDMESDHGSSDVDSEDGINNAQGSAFHYNEVNASFSPLEQLSPVNSANVDSGFQHTYFDDTHTRTFEDIDDIPESNMRTRITPTSSSSRPADVILFDNLQPYTYANFNSGSSATSAAEHPREPQLLGFVQPVPSLDPFSWTTTSKVSERQPSPSDAAMVKPLPPSGSSAPSVMQNKELHHPVAIHHMPTSAWQQFTSKTFADNSQKKEFFQAREQNRAMINAKADGDGSLMGHHQTTPLGAGALGTFFDPTRPFEKSIPRPTGYLPFQKATAKLNSEVCNDEIKSYTEAMAYLELTMDTPSDFVEAVANAMIEDDNRLEVAQAVRAIARARKEPALEFIARDLEMGVAIDHTAVPEGQDVHPHHFAKHLPTPLAHIPGLDMTSAVAFNKSKASNEAFATLINHEAASHNNKAYSEASINLNPVPIGSVSQSSKDLEDQGLTSAPRSLKRKAENISDVLEDELHAWAAIDPNGGENNETKSEPRAAESVSVTVLEAPVSAPTLTESQPVTIAQDLPNKRLKTIAEKAGYFALGGLAATAGLFSVLVATAPDFL